MENTRIYYFTFNRWVLRFLMLAVFILVSLVVAAQSKTNIILIVSDDLGYRDIGPFNGEEITPVLDRLAREGVKATNFYVASPACTPSRGSILTGRYPQRNGMYDMIRNDMVNYGHKFTQMEYRRQPEATLGMDLREKTLADMLKTAGYTNGMVGKWDGGRATPYLPLQRGFDSFLGIVNTGVDYWTHERYGIPSLYRNNDLVKEEGFLVTLEGREAIHFINENHDRPFFLYFASFAPHGASNLDRSGIKPPKEYLDLYPNRDPHDKRTEYMAAVSSLDAQIGEILDLLEEYGIAENTLIIFHSDNGGPGPADNSPLRGGKATLWEGGVRVPFLARWPGVIPAGTTTDAFLSSLELMPTIAAVANTWVPDATMDGYNMLPILKGEINTSPRTEMFWQWMDESAARVGNYKWVHRKDGTGGLFDLSKDIGEQHDVSDEKPETLDDIKKRWSEWRREMESAPPRGPFYSKFLYLDLPH